VGSRIVRPHQVLLLARSATDLGCRTGCSCRTSEKIALRRFSIRHRPMVASDLLHHCQLLVRKRLSHSAILDPARINPSSLLHFPFGASSSLRCSEGHGHTSICNAPCSATDTRELISAAGTAEGGTSGSCCPRLSHHLNGTCATLQRASCWQPSARRSAPYGAGCGKATSRRARRR
jgi:hypothetical protein